MKCTRPLISTCCPSHSPAVLVPGGQPACFCHLHWVAGLKAPAEEGGVALRPPPPSPLPAQSGRCPRRGEEHPSFAFGFLSRAPPPPGGSRPTASFEFSYNSPCDVYIPNWRHLQASVTNKPQPPAALPPPTTTTTKATSLTLGGGGVDEEQNDRRTGQEAASR